MLTVATRKVHFEGQNKVHQKALVILYTRPGCHLCEVAKAEMLAAKCADLYELKEVNIDSDPELSQHYRTLIPVISINGVDTFKYRVTAERFRESVMRVSITESN